MPRSLTNGIGTVNSTSLCAPAPGLSCFGCCPPIRPAHYDPLEYVGSLRREFRENRARYLEEGPRHRPIIGYSCWALGNLDARGRTIGCLLHPCRNHGVDLRHLVDYGDKCRREQCLAAREFACLPPEGKRYWLPLVQGLNAYWFSSPKANPLFHLMLWGGGVLEPLRALAESRGWTATELLWREPFLSDGLWIPRAHGYLFRLLLENLDPLGYAEGDLPRRCQSLLRALLGLPEVRSRCEPQDDAGVPFVHNLGLDTGLQDLLRLGLGWRRCSPHEAGRLHEVLLTWLAEKRETGDRPRD